MKKFSVIIAVAVLLAGAQFGFAQSLGKVTGLPLPRFISLKSNKVKMRVGPGREYAIQWLYVRRGLPVEIIQEFDRWRQIRDSEGTVGWVFHSLLSGKRTAIVLSKDGNAAADDEENYTKAYARQSISSNAVARFQPGVVVEIVRCGGKWCEIKIGNSIVNIEQLRLWGAYPDEKFKG